MMTIDENTLGVWYIQTSATQDFMGTLSRNPDGNGYTFTYRFRYYKDNKAFDSNDEKSWYTIKIKGTEDPTNTIKELIAQFSAYTLEPAIELLMGEGGVKEFMEKFMELPFVHHKIVSIN